ncbi:hypothetical protein DFH07DRAFT_971838 [Mycena maculata]|uniref:SH3 domain-containing protein n=1 Tax=Mycena maculata TaxID=230809 RepID=A0AAD7HKE9_9AGAR|nr:hypothetical protein DFH07DRAFT_971838 [Mycena maculata]
MRFFFASIAALAGFAAVSAAPKFKRAGGITEPVAGTSISTGSSIPFDYFDDNSCEEGYTPITIWLSQSAPTALNSTGGLDPGTFIEYYGQFLINNFGPPLPVLQPVPPTSLTIPDISSFAVGSSLFLTVVEEALPGTCPGGVDQPARYDFATVSLTVEYKIGMEPTFLPPPPREVIDIDDFDDEGPAMRKEPLPTTTSSAGNVFSDFESDEENENEDENEVEHKPLIAPSTDIKGDFEDALQDGFEFDGTFAFSQRYGIGAPNPCLNIDGLGTVGIPLSERDARAIISACAPMPSEKVHFDNPAWDAWIQKTAGVAATTALNANTGANPSFTLKKMVIHETGSHISRHKEPITDDPAETKIGDLIVILPGLFQGAQLQLSHAGQAKSLNFAHQSGISTSIVAAYSGVEHTLAGVTAGYRLSLIYDIVQPITHVEYRPTLPEMQGATQKLHNIMLSWKQDASGEAPESLACLLQHKYSRAPNFGAKSLTGADALLISHLYPLARELKFSIYLAHVQLTVFTTAEARGYDYSHRRGWGYDDSDDDDEIDEDECVDDDDPEETLQITQIVDLRGMPVHIGLELEVDDLINGSLTEYDPDRETFDRDERTTASRTKIYNRTALLLWPKDTDVDFSVTIGDIYDYACNALRSSLTVAPTKKEKKLVDKLLACCQIRRQEAKLSQVVQVLRESADRWNDVQVLLQALKTCGVDKNIDLMGVEGFVSAYQAFGWDALKDFYGDAMKNDVSNGRRHALLARLTQMAVKEDDAEVSVWCKEQEENVLRTLSKMEVAQIPWLADLGLSRGGEFLRDVIFPQLQAQNLDKTFWIPFVRRLQQSVRDIPTTSPEVVSGLIVQCVSETARNLAAFPTKTIQYGYAYSYSAAPTRQEKNSDAILEVIKFCVETNNQVLCTGIFAKMRKAASLGTFTTAFPPWLYYTELFPALTEYARSIPTAGLDTIFQPFFIDVIDSLISAARTTTDRKAITPCPLAEQHKAIIMLAARKAGGITILQQRLTADKLAGHDSPTLQALARSVTREFPRQQMQDSTALQAHTDLIATLVRAAIDTFNTSSLRRPPGHYYSGYNANSSASDQMISLVKFCFELGAQGHCQHLLLRFVPPPAGSTVPQHISGVLAPFLPVLRQYLAGKHLDFQTEPYKKFAAAVVKSFAEKVMVQKPSEVVPVARLQGIGCGACTECGLLRAFFLGERQTIAFARVQGVRTHLERQLGATRAWGVVWSTIRSGSPHTLQVTKPASMTALGLWADNSQKGKVLLNSLGDQATQTRILGADYGWVYARIYGTNNAPMPPPPAVHTNAPMPFANTLNAPKRPAAAALPAVLAKKARTS